MTGPAGSGLTVLVGTKARLDIALRPRDERSRIKTAHSRRSSLSSRPSSRAGLPIVVANPPPER